jgi:VCBS repeat-containing protein
MKKEKTVNIKRKKIGLCTLVLAGLIATGARCSAADQLTTGKVGTITVGANGDFLFHLENHPPLCAKVTTRDDQDWITVTDYATADAKKVLLSILLGAKLSGRSVQVRALNNNTNGELGCRIEAMDLL